MKFKGCRANRSELEIIYDVLGCLVEESPLTHVLYCANLEYLKLVEVLVMLKDKGLVFERRVGRRRFFVLSKKGFGVKAELDVMFERVREVLYVD